MTRRAPQEITQLLLAWRNGDRAAMDRLIPLVYDTLRKQAHNYMSRRRADHVLQTSDLIHEAYLQLLNAGQVNWQDRLHFFAISAKLMRQVLIHLARSRGSQKRGGRFLQVSLSEGDAHAPDPPADIIRLDDALEALAKIDPRKARVVELRFFSGLTMEETAEVLEVSADTVWRDWDLAKTWLWREMQQERRPASRR
ncbi:MAG: sigma-70 family RNA polymerase sigma factor [Acidobacteria bacterium]|nr:sigma-70 family RNA polymerase sigma factor [Acidobacteriota bacterium]